MMSKLKCLQENYCIYQVGENFPVKTLIKISPVEMSILLKWPLVNEFFLRLLLEKAVLQPCVGRFVWDNWGYRWGSCHNEFIFLGYRKFQTFSGFKWDFDLLNL